METTLPSTLQKIIAATDFSECSSNAVRYGLGLAIQAEAKLMLFNSVGIPGAGSDMLVNPLHLLEKISQDRLEKAIAEMGEALKQNGGPNLEMNYAVRAGFPSENVIQVAKEEEADLLIVGTKGIRKGVGWLLGSTSSEVVRRSKTPVLAVPCDANPVPMKKIVLAADMKTLSRTTLDPVFALAKLFDSELEVLHVIPPQEHFSPSAFEEFKSDFSAKCPLDKVSFHLFETEESAVATAIQDYVQFQDADLVVMTSRPRSLLGRLFHPSTSKQVSLETTIPLLVLHETAPE